MECHIAPLSNHLSGSGRQTLASNAWTDNTSTDQFISFQYDTQTSRYFILKNDSYHLANRLGTHHQYHWRQSFLKYHPKQHKHCGHDHLAKHYQRFSLSELSCTHQDWKTIRLAQTQTTIAFTFICLITWQCNQDIVQYCWCISIWHHTLPSFYE